MPKQPKITSAWTLFSNYLVPSASALHILWVLHLGRFVCIAAFPFVGRRRAPLGMCSALRELMKAPTGLALEATNPLRLYCFTYGFTVLAIGCFSHYVRETLRTIGGPLVPYKNNNERM